MTDPVKFSTDFKRTLFNFFIHPFLTHIKIMVIPKRKPKQIKKSTSKPIDKPKMFDKYAKAELIDALEKVQKSNVEILESLKQIQKR